jgi:hypothetical protein
MQVHTRGEREFILGAVFDRFADLRALDSRRGELLTDYY